MTTRAEIQDTLVDCEHLWSLHEYLLMNWSQTKQASMASRKPIRGKVKLETVDKTTFRIMHMTVPTNVVMLNADVYFSSVSPPYRSH